MDKKRILKPSEPHRNFRVHRKNRELRKYDFDYVKFLGNGAFGDVSLQQVKETKEIFAIKEIKKDKL